MLSRDNGHYVFSAPMRKFSREKNNYEKGHFVVGVDRPVTQLYLYVSRKRIKLVDRYVFVNNLTA